MNFLRLAKSAPAFVLACALGIGLTQAVRQVPQVRRQAKQGFTSEEARAHLRKRVRSNLECRTCSVEKERTTGRTIFFQKSDWGGQYVIAVDWDISFRGRHEVIFYDKENYEKWVTETGPSEDQ